MPENSDDKKKIVLKPMTGTSKPAGPSVPTSIGPGVPSSPDPSSPPASQGNMQETGQKARKTIKLRPLKTKHKFATEAPKAAVPQSGPTMPMPQADASADNTPTSPLSAPPPAEEAVASATGFDTADTVSVEKQKKAQDSIPAVSGDQIDETVAVDRKGIGEGPESVDETLDLSDKNFQEDITQKISLTPTQTRQAVPPSAGSMVPGAKKTIKLRPSSTATNLTDVSPPAAKVKAGGATIKLKPKAPPPAQTTTSDSEEKTIAMAKQTIKLVPKKPGQVKPSDPTVELGAPAIPKPSDPTTLMPPPAGAGEGQEVTETATVVDQTKPIVPKASDPTVQMTAVPPPPGGEQAQTKSKLSIRKSTPSSVDQPAAGPMDMEEGQLSPGGAKVPKAGAGEEQEKPSVIFAIASIITLVAMIYLTLLLGGQFANQWLDQKIPVPGANSLVGK